MVEHAEENKAVDIHSSIFTVSSKKVHLKAIV